MIIAVKAEKGINGLIAQSSIVLFMMRKRKIGSSISTCDTVAANWLKNRY